MSEEELMQLAQKGAAENFERGIALLEAAKTRENYAEAFRLIQTAADAGDKDALFQLGTMLDEGIGTRRDLPAAFAAFLQAAHAGMPAAQLRAAQMLENGRGTEINYVMAAEWYEAAARGGRAEGWLALGKLNANGRGVIQDYGRALALYQDAARAGNADGLAAVAWATIHGWGLSADPKAGIGQLEAAAAQGSARAALGLAEIFSGDGDLVAADESKAFLWLERAAALGDARAQLLLARQLATGAWTGVVDIPEAIDYFVEAAKGGSSQALIDLGRVLLKSFPGRASFEHTIDFATQAFAAGNNEAALLLAQLSLINPPPPAAEQSIRTALELAAQEGSWRAAHAVGLLADGRSYPEAITAASSAAREDYINMSLEAKPTPAGSTLPRARSTPPPELPGGLRIQGFSGTVNVNFTIGREGHVRSVRVLDGANPAIIGAIKTALRSWEFDPATEEGAPVPIRISLPITFHGRE
ncbi:MAG: TonB family protein [Opitutaceae bacterium]